MIIQLSLNPDLCSGLMLGVQLVRYEKIFFQEDYRFCRGKNWDRFILDVIP